MPISRSDQERLRGWLQAKAAGDDEDASYATLVLQWIAELGSPFQDAQRVEVVDQRPQGPIVNPTPKDTMIQIRFRAKRGTVSISELEETTDDT